MKKEQELMKPNELKNKEEQEWENYQKELELAIENH